MGHVLGQIGNIAGTIAPIAVYTGVVVGTAARAYFTLGVCVVADVALGGGLFDGGSLIASSLLPPGEGIAPDQGAESITCVGDVLENPEVLAGKSPSDVEPVLGDTPGRRVERLGQGAHKGQGWQDELALDFDAVAPVARSLQAEALLSEKQVRAIEAVHRQLDKMSGHQHILLWADTGIARAPEWDRVRELAKNALALLLQEEPI